MRTVVKQLVSVSFITIIYYLYGLQLSTFDKTSLWFQLFDPFKLVVLGALFAVILATVRTVFFKKMNDLKFYRKTRRDNILFNFEATVAYAKSLKKAIDANDASEAKKVLATFGGVKFQPVYLQTLVNDLSEMIINKQNLSILSKPATIVVEGCQKFLDKEEARIAGTNKTKNFDKKMTEEFGSLGSWTSIDYQMALSERNHATKSAQAWKVNSLYSLRYGAHVATSLSINLIVYIIIAFAMGGKHIDQYYISYFVGTTTLLAILINLFYLLVEVKGRRKLQVNFLPTFVIYIVLILMGLNIAVSIKMFPTEFPDSTTKDIMELPFTQFLLCLLYVSLSTLALYYVYATIVDGTREGSMSMGLLVEGIILPLVFFTITTVYAYIAVFNNDPTIASTKGEAAKTADYSDANELMLGNAAILTVYWIATMVFGSRISQTVSNVSKGVSKVGKSITKVVDKKDSKKASAKK